MNIKTLTLICLSFGITYTSLPAQTSHTVCASGCDFTTIAAAVAAATSSDFIIIEDASHSEHSITIDKNLTFCSNPIGNTVQAGGAGRIFDIAATASVLINDLNLSGGSVGGNAAGGAIRNAGILGLINCTISASRANRGGAIFSSNELGIANCTFSGNSAITDGGNIASGGAIYASGTVGIINTTVSGNASQGEGGGITLSSGAHYFAYLTIASNAASGGTSGAGLSIASGGLLDMANTIIASNTNGIDLATAETINSPAGFELTLNGTNVVTSCTGSCPATYPFIPTAPGLGALSSANGGCTATRSIAVSSSANNQGIALLSFQPAGLPFDVTSYLNKDQRGALRSGGAPDVGAYENGGVAPACEASSLCEVVLSVELLAFTASELEESVLLQWSTATETNNAGFELQHSGLGDHWEKIAFLPGQGDAFTDHEYEYLDRQPLPGMNYYLLKQLDFDGQSTYSKIVAVEMDQAINPFRVFPNPAKKAVTIKLPAKHSAYQLQLINSLGQIVWEERPEEGTTSTTLSFATYRLEAGIYVLYISEVDGRKSKRQAIRMVVE